MRLLCLLLIVASCPFIYGGSPGLASLALAQDYNSQPAVELPQELPNRLDEINRNTSGELPNESEQNFLRTLLFYLPNRIIDLYDVFRIDVGLGGSGGAVVRATRYGQVGYRAVDPFSVRIGTFGRHIPFLLEKHTESGFGADFEQSPNRTVTPYEIGIGADLLVGAYIGISLDELGDFFAGILFFDPKSDDLGR